MASRRFQCVLLTTLAAVVLCVALGPERAAATEESAGGTITTVLQPGYNLIAWLGSDAPSDDIFNQVPNLERISAWDGEAQDYRRRTRTSIPGDGLQRLEQGSGVFLYVAGDSPVEWTREASEDSMLLDLRAGRNLVGWAGRDGTPIEEAVVRFGDALTRAWLWDAETQRYLYYRPAGPEHTHPLRELNHGDALWVELSGDARWWQSGTAPVPVEILGDYTEYERWQIRGWVDGNRGFFAERWGVEAPVTTYAGDRASVTPVWQRLLGSSGRPPCGIFLVREKVIFLVDDCVNGGTHAHEYFHAIQFDLMGSPQKAVPAWIREGSAVYAQTLYGGTTYFRRLHPDFPTTALTAEARIEERRESDASVGYGFWPPLSGTEGGPDVTGPLPQGAYYDLGFLGIAWLAERAGDQSVIEFYRQLGDEPDWRKAFEPAFGMTVEEFHEQFDAYRDAAAPVLPHTTDGSDEPVVEFLGDISRGRQAALQAEFDRVRAFLGEQFGAGETDYTLYSVRGTDAANEAHVRVFGAEWDRPSCVKHAFRRAAIVGEGCSLLRVHFDAARAIEAGVHHELGPLWLVNGARPHVFLAYLSATRHDDAESRRSATVTNALRTELSLRDLAHLGPFWSDARESAYALSTLAVGHLLEQSGGPALFEYYRLLGNSIRWQDAFAEAFGITLGDFYEDFEASRSGIAPTHSPVAAAPSPGDATPDQVLFDGPLPHTTDDSGAPVLVFLGDVPSNVREAIREEFGRLEAFFDEQLGAGTADYTMLVAADDAWARAAHRLVYGRENDRYCNDALGGLAGLINLGCSAPVRAYGLSWPHFVNVRYQSAPLRSAHRGPAWLERAAAAYVEYRYLDAVGPWNYESLRATEVSRARDTARPLSSMAAPDVFSSDAFWAARGVAVLAVEWLFEHAGDTALFDYYRRLPGSDSWEEAFEAAFGIAIDEFYEAFEAYRARIAPPNEDADSS